MIFVLGWGGEIWRTVAFYNMVAGVIGALVAAIPGLIDLLSLPTAPKRTALVHMSLNLTIVALYIVNIWMRLSSPDTFHLPFVLSLVAIALLTVSGWLGGKMVYEHGVAVDTGEEAPGVRVTHMRHGHG